MSYSLNYSKGRYIGGYIVGYYIERDTRNLDYSSYG